MIELCECAGDDRFMAAQIEILERDLQQEFGGARPGSPSTREDALITTHVLSGHLFGAQAP